MIFDEDYLLVLKFCAYILRHHGLFIPIEQLADNEEITKDIQKAERFVIQEDLDDLYNGLEMEVINFNDYREVTMNGFKEMIALNEETRRNIEEFTRNENKNLIQKLNDDFKKINSKIKKQDEQIKEQAAILMRGQDGALDGDGQPGLNAAMISGPLEVKIFTLETQLKNLKFKVDNSLSNVINELGVKSIVLDEMNIHSKLINDNLKQNLII